MTKYAKFAVLALVLCSQSAFAQDWSRSVPTKRQLGTNSVIAVVEDKIITRDEIVKDVEPFIPRARAESRSEAEFQRKVQAQMAEIVNDKIDRVLIIKEFKSKGYAIPQGTYDSKFEDYLQGEFNNDRAEFLKHVQSMGKTVKQFREEMNEDIIVGAMLQQQRLTVTAVSPEKIMEYYEQHKDSWFLPASAKMRQISLKVGKKPEAEQMKLAKEIVEKARAGESFEELAKKHSEDMYGPKGGEYGLIKKGDYTPLLDEAIFKLKSGEVSDPVLTGNMIFIFKADEAIAEGIQPVDDVRNEIEYRLVDQYRKAAHQKWIESLRKKAYIKYYQ